MLGAFGFLPSRRAHWIHTSRFALYPARSRARLLPALRPLSSPRPPSRGPSLTRATAAAGGEQAQPLKLPPGPRLGPGSGSGATVGGVRCEVTGPRCVHAVARRARGRGYRIHTSALGAFATHAPFRHPGRRAGGDPGYCGDRWRYLMFPCENARSFESAGHSSSSVRYFASLSGSTATPSPGSSGTCTMPSRTGNGSASMSSFR